MKRRIILLLLLLLPVLLAGCQEEKTVGVCFRQVDAYATPLLENSLSEALEKAGYAVETADAANDQAKQLSVVRQFIEAEADLLIIEPVMTAEAGEIVRLAKEANTPVIFLNYQPEAQVLSSWDKLCYIGCDRTKLAEAQAALVARLQDGGDLNGDGSTAYIAIAGSEGHLDAESWAAACDEALAGEQLALDFGDWSRQNGQALCAKRLAQFGKDIEVILCNTDELALGALEAVKDGGRTNGKDVYLVGIGGDRQALFLIKSGDLTGTVCPDPMAMTQAVLSAAESLLAGKQPQQVILTEFTAVTLENVDQFLQ